MTLHDLVQVIIKLVHYMPIEGTGPGQWCSFWCSVAKIVPFFERLEPLYSSFSVSCPASWHFHVVFFRKFER